MADHRSDQELARQAKQTRKRLLQAEAVALSLLISRRNEATTGGGSISGIAQRIQKNFLAGIVSVRSLSRDSGVSQLSQELASVGASAPDIYPLPLIARDITRASHYSRSYAERWAKKAQGDSIAEAVETANAATSGSLERIAVTESAEAFNGGRDSVAAELPRSTTTLLKVWDSTLDKLTCPVCAVADGAIVGIKELFPQGTPGAMHPFCRCTWQALTFEERGDHDLIAPKAPAKVLSFPAQKTS